MLIAQSGDDIVHDVTVVWLSLGACLASRMSVEIPRGQSDLLAKGRRNGKEKCDVAGCRERDKGGQTYSACAYVDAEAIFQFLLQHTCSLIEPVVRSKRHAFAKPTNMWMNR